MTVKRIIYPLTIIFLLFTALRLSYMPAPQQALENCWQQQAAVLGRVEPLSVRHTERGTSFVLAAEQITLPAAGKSFPYKYKLRVFTAAEANGGKMPRLQAGRVLCRGELRPLANLRNPGTWDGESWNFVNGYGGRLVQAQVSVLDERPGILDSFALSNLRLRERLQLYLPGERGALLCGMLLGGGSGIEEETRELFQNNGLAHLLSVSGTHLMLLAALLLLLAKALPLGAGWRKSLVFIVLCAYACLCGLRPPVLRALCMSGALLCGGSSLLRNRRQEAASENERPAVQNVLDKGSVFCLTAILLLCWQPAWLLNIGFQLSFGAAAGLLWLLPRLQELLAGRWQGLGDMIAVTLAAQLALLPLEIAYFHQLSLISVISNLLLVPLLELAVLSALGGLLLAALPLLSAPGIWTLQAAGFIIEQVLAQAAWLQSLPWATVTVPLLPLWCAAVYYALLVLALDLEIVFSLQAKERRLAAAFLALLLSGALCWQHFKPQPLTAYFLDVGQGDCTVIISPQRRVAVVDTGGLANFDTGSRIVVPFLRSLGYDQVDLLLLTHSDFDHVGGAAGLARNLRIKKIILPQEELTAGGAENLRPLWRYVKREKAERARQGKSYDLGEAHLRLEAVPQAAVSGNEASTLAGLYDGQGRRCLLLPGDMGLRREQELADAGSWAVLKAGHHGSKSSSGEEFLARVRPLLAVISCGKDNRYGHPHQETLARLHEAGAKVMRTDEQGALKVVFDEKGLTCYSYKEMKTRF